MNLRENNANGEHAATTLSNKITLKMVMSELQSMKELVNKIMENIRFVFNVLCSLNPDS